MHDLTYIHDIFQESDEEQDVLETSKYTHIKVARLSTVM